MCSYKIPFLEISLSIYSYYFFYHFLFFFNAQRSFDYQNLSNISRDPDKGHHQTASDAYTGISATDITFVPQIKFNPSLKGKVKFVIPPIPCISRQMQRF